MMQRQSHQLPYAAAERWLLIYSTILALAAAGWWLAPGIARIGFLHISIGFATLIAGPFVIWWHRHATKSNGRGAVALISLLALLFVSLCAALIVFLGIGADIDGKFHFPASLAGELYEGIGLSLPGFVCVALVWCCVIMIKRKRRIQ